jgi:peptidoglycan/LPS O-acetylase OafA/YrhL
MSAVSGASTLREGLRDLLHPSPKTVPGLDLLRATAVLLVMSGHWGMRFLKSTHSNLPVLQLPVFHFGWTGVDLFFVLSGLLIGGQLWREQRRTGTIDVPRFLLRRGMRIWPYYFAFVAFIMIFLPDLGWRQHLAAHGWRHFLPDLLFLSNYRPGAVAGGWSLSTEEQFYIAVPLLLLATRRWPLSRQWIVPLAALVLLPVARFLAIRHAGVSSLPAHPMVIYCPFHTHSDGLVVGLLIAWLSVAVPRAVAPLPPLRNLVFPALMIAIGVVLHTCNDDIFSFSALALIFGAAALFVLRDASTFSRLASWRPFYVISRLSYAMYLNHFVLLEWLGPEYLAAVPGGGNISFVLGYAGLIGISAAIAAVTFLLIESPFLQWRERLMARSSSAARQEPQAAAGYPIAK